MLSSQTSFVDGLDFLSSDIQISKFGYQWLINARQRFGYIQPNNKALNLTQYAPAGKMQGLVSVGNILVLFVNGKAYYQFDGDTFWAQIAGFTMDATVYRYYTVFIPDSSNSFSRSLNVSGNIIDPIIKKSNISINGTPQGLLVQDGINQPHIITFDPVSKLPSARETKTYDEWDNDGVNQEYVPVGTIMLYVAPILFIVSVDRKKIYHSISGRPLDFMVNIDIAGNKLSTESLGGADSVSFAFDNDEITCLASTNIPDSFFVSSRTTSRIISFDYTRTVFGEPNFVVSVVLGIGAVNEFSFQDILGDYSVIDIDGVKSFDAVQQYKVQGQNSIFSQKLQRLLQKDVNNYIRQDNPNCVSFNNYVIYSLKTNMGNVLVVYDNILNKWVSIDITECSRVKQFAIINVDGIDKKLYALTHYNEIFQLYADSDTEQAQLFTRAFTYQPETQNGQYSISFKQKSEFVKLLFEGGNEESQATIVEYVDGSESQRLTQNLSPQIAGVKPPVKMPVIPSSEDTTLPLTFTLNDGLSGNKIAYVIQWKSNARLLAFEIQTQDNLPVSGKTQVEQQLTGKI